MSGKEDLPMTDVVDIRQQIREQWEKRLAGEALSLPSGIQVLVRPVSLLGLVKEGKIPNSLFAIAVKTLEESQEPSKPEDIVEMAELTAIMVGESLVYPTLFNPTLWFIQHFHPENPIGQTRSHLVTLEMLTSSSL
jgi:hypothetical protein